VLEPEPPVVRRAAFEDDEGLTGGVARSQIARARDLVLAAGSGVGAPDSAARTPYPLPTDA